MSTQSKPRWYKPDRGLAARMVLTMFLLGAVYVVFAGVLAYLRVPLVLLIFLAAALAFIQFFFADKIALASMGARIVTEPEAPEVYAMVSRLAMQANLPTPKIAIVDTSVPNAFATGRNPQNAVVAITTGLLYGHGLTEPELEAVLAHELTHIINRDMLVMTIATFFSMVAALIVRNAFWIAMFGGFGGGGGYGGRRRNDDGAVLVILASVVAYALSFLLVRALSRYRELAADRGSALITGAPENLASALLKISNSMKHIPDRDIRTVQGVNALFIVPAIKGDSFAVLLSTHPSTEERVRRLEQMQRNMEQAPRF